MAGGEEQHSYQGYTLAVDGTVGEEQRRFTVGIGKAAQTKHGFRAGDAISGMGVPVPDPSVEPVEVYKVSKLVRGDNDPPITGEPPPWGGVPPELPVYRTKGHRRISQAIYDAECVTCIWGCRMPVVDGPVTLETHCYGPKNCLFFEAPAEEAPS